MNSILVILSAINGFLLSWIWLVFLGVGVARLATTKGDENRKKSGKKILLWGIILFILFVTLSFLLPYLLYLLSISRK